MTSINTAYAPPSVAKGSPPEAVAADARAAAAASAAAAQAVAALEADRQSGAGADAIKAGQQAVLTAKVVESAANNKVAGDQDGGLDVTV